MVFVLAKENKAYKLQWVLIVFNGKFLLNPV